MEPGWCWLAMEYGGDFMDGDIPGCCPGMDVAGAIPGTPGPMPWAWAMAMLTPTPPGPVCIIMEACCCMWDGRGPSLGGPTIPAPFMPGPIMPTPLAMDTAGRSPPMPCTSMLLCALSLGTL